MAEFSDVVAEIQKSNKKLDKLTQATDPKGAAAVEDKRDAAKSDKDQTAYLKAIADAVSGIGGGPGGDPDDKEGKKVGGIFSKIAGALGGLGAGLGATIGGFAAGLAGTLGRLAIAGKFVIAMGALGAGLAAFVVALGAGAFLVSKMMPSIAEGLSAFDEVDGKNLGEVGDGMFAIGKGLGAMGAGGAIGALGGLIESIADGLGGLFGVEPGKARLIDDLIEFGEVEINAEGVERNAKAMVAYGKAMALGSGGNVLGAIAGLAAGIFDKFSEMIGAVPLLDKVKAFGEETIDCEAVANNARALVEYTKAMAIGVGAQTAEALGAVVNFATTAVDGITKFIGGEGFLDSTLGGLKKMSASAKDINPDNISNVAKAMVAYTGAMAAGAIGEAFKAAGSIFNFVTQAADGLSKFIGGQGVLDSQLEGLKKMSEASAGIDAKKVENVSDAMVSYAKAMAAGGVGEGGKAIGSFSNFVGNVVEGIGKLIGIEGSDPIADLKEFAKVEITDQEVTSIEKNSAALSAYGAAMVAMSSAEVKSTLGDTITNVMQGIGSLFGFGKGDPLENLKDFAGLNLDSEGIKTDVTNLMSILEDPNIDVAKSTSFKTILTDVGDALESFSTSGFVGALAGVGTSMLNFLRGNESPIAEMLTIGESADSLERGADALDRISESLGRIANLTFSGDDIKIKEFALDLLAAVPVIEGAIMGGTVDPPGTGNKVTLKGLASENIEWAEAAQNISLIMRAFQIKDARGNIGANLPHNMYSGGPIRAGQPYIVGEGGPEMIIPSTAGQVMNSQRTLQMQQASLQKSIQGMGGSGSVLNNMPVSNISTNQSNTTVTSTPMRHPSPIIDMVNSAA